jgi:hypothetical protein
MDYSELGPAVQRRLASLSEEERTEYLKNYNVLKPNSQPEYGEKTESVEEVTPADNRTLEEINAEDRLNYLTSFEDVLCDEATGQEPEAVEVYDALPLEPQTLVHTEKELDRKPPVPKTESVKEQDQIIKSLDERFNRRFILIPRFLMELTDDYEIMHFLAYGINWQKSSNDTGGWWFRYQEEIEADTKIALRQQRRIRKVLTEWGILFEQRRGIPPRNYYRIDVGAILSYIDGGTVIK